MFEWLFDVFIDTGSAVASTWVAVFVVVMLIMALSRIFNQVKTCKIQKRKYRWTTFRHEILWSGLNIAITSLVLKEYSALLVDKGFLTNATGPVAWYTVLFEFALYFFIFDFYFYWVHRTIHIEPLYTWIHKTHHFSISPTPLSSSSMTPLEGIMEGLIVPTFLAVVTVHETTTYFIIPFATLMGLYVHCGHEFMPRWWYRNPTTGWLISPMFHDQHHQYFTCNYGAYTTIWDKVFGTVRPKFYSDFNSLKSKSKSVESPLKVN